MNKFIKYAIKLRNGGYMKEEWDGSLERVKLYSVDNPIDSSLYKSKDTIQRIFNQILNGSTNILTLYDENNPPESIVELTINFEITKLYRKDMIIGE